jgi:hypothetical protein
MLCKCANPACFERFLFLHRGKLFHLSPTPEVTASSEGSSPALEERFWLCPSCSKKMTVVWGGDRPQLKHVSSKRVTELRPARFRTHPAFFGWDVE